MIKTRVSDLLGIEYPILKGGMVWVSNSRLTAAVSNAGGLGVMGIGAMDMDTFAKELEALKGMTDKPFGVSCPLIRPDYETMLGAAIESGVNVIVTSAGNPAKVNRMLLDAGVTAIHVVANVRMAKKVEDLGYHMVVAEGFEAGGHNGRDELTTFTLVPQVVDAVSIPVIAAGGIADARGMVAAFALGAEGIQMGTRFVATRESPVHDNFKMAIVNARDTDTTITGRAFSDPTRVIKNAFTEKIIDAERKGVDPAKILEMIGSDRTYIGSVKGDLQNGSLMSGQVAGMIKELKSVQEVMEDIILGLGPVIGRLSDTFKTLPG